MSNQPYVAIICTADRLPLRDGLGTIWFNVNLSTAVVGNGAAAVDLSHFIANAQTQKMLRMWDQTLATDGTSLLFDVFVIAPGSPTVVTSAVGKATPPSPNWIDLASPCRAALDDELSELVMDGDFSLLLWDPFNPSGGQPSSPPSGSAASAYRHTAWQNTVAHASTWPKPVPQGLNLSFEVHIQAPPASDSVVIFPRFGHGEAVSSVSSVLNHNDAWNSYEGKYLSGSPAMASGRRAYQLPCAVQPQPAGLFDVQTYWISRDPAAAVQSTSKWRQTLEATVGSRFDYLPRLLSAIERTFGSGLTGSPSIAPMVWNLGIQMLKDLSNFGDQVGFEASASAQGSQSPTLQYTLLLRAFEAVDGHGTPGLPQTVTNFVNLLRTQPGDWRKQIWTFLQGIDQTLASYFATASPAGSDMVSLPAGPLGGPPAVLPALRRLYAALSNDDNLQPFLFAWWNSKIAPAGSPEPAGWSSVSDQLQNTVFPSAQLHKRYLSAIGASARPLSGTGAPAIKDALNTAFPGRVGHTAILAGSPAQMVIFGGDAGNGTLLGDVWMMGADADSAQPWIQLTPGGIRQPSARRGHSAVFDPGSWQMLVFGGFSGRAGVNDLWSLSLPNLAPKGSPPPPLANPAWTPLTPSGASPLARTGHSAVYDPMQQCMIVFGGDTGTPLHPNPVNDVWILQKGSGGSFQWLGLHLATTAVPPARSFHTAVYDLSTKQMIVFGGIDATGQPVPNDVWVLSNADVAGSPPVAVWSKLQVAAGQLPGPRQNHSAIYDQASRSMAIFGGLRNGSPLPDAWVLSNANGATGSPAAAPAWRPLSPIGQVPPKYGHSAVYDNPGPWQRMIVFSGAPNPVPDVWSLSAVFGAGPAWSRLNPSGNPQLDAAVRAAIRGWVNSCGQRSGLAASSPFLAELDSIVATDLLDSQAGLSTVADDTPEPEKRPHPVVIQVGQWDTSSQDGPASDLRQIAGVGVLIRKAGGSPASPWRCLNAADITLTYHGSPSIIRTLTDKFVPSRLQYRSGMKDPFISYDNHPLIAKTPAVGLQGKFGGTLASEDQNPTDSLFTYVPAAGPFGKIYGLIFGTTYDLAPFAIGHGGAMPAEIELAMASSPPADIGFNDPRGAVIREVPYYRRVPVGHVRVMPPPQVAAPPGSSLEWGPNPKGTQWPAIPPTVYPLARDFGLTGSAGSGSPPQGTPARDNVPLLLLPFVAKPAGTIGTVSFHVLPPVTDINTWDRWVSDGSAYDPGSATDTNTRNTRKGVWAAFHRDMRPDQQNAVTNRIGDPAVASLLFRLESYVPAPGSPDLYSGHWQQVGADQFMIVSYPPAAAPFDSAAAWAAVWSAPVPVTVKQGSFGFPPATASGLTISVPPGGIARLTVMPLVKAAAFTSRFEPDIFATRTYTSGGVSYVSVGVDYQALGIDDTESSPELVLLIECPTTAMITPATVKQLFTPDFDEDKRKLTGMIGGLLETFLSVGKFEIRRQDWRWLGRPLPDLPPANGAITSPASPISVQDWEDLAFLDRLSGDYKVSYTRFNLKGGDSLDLTSIDLSGDLRSQYVRFIILAHNRYENMPGFQPASASALLDHPWKGALIPRGDVPKPPKPNMRLVLPIAKRANAFDLVGIGEESWYRFGGLGETLVARIQPVLGSRVQTILFGGSPQVQDLVQINEFGGDNGVTYLDTGAPLTLVAPQSPPQPLEAGEYSFTTFSASPQNTIAHYLFSPEDNGVNVAISYRQLDQRAIQHYEFGPDQIVVGSAAQASLPQIVLEPMGATLEDEEIVAPNYSNTYFKGSVIGDSWALVTWKQFKVQFRRELRAYSGSNVATVVSDWTDAMWIQTIPDSATFKQGTGSVQVTDITASWTPSPLSPGAPLVVTPAIQPTSPLFELWYVVTRNIFDVFGKPAEVYVQPVSGGTPDNPLFALPAGSYNLQIVEVQKSPAVLPSPPPPFTGSFDTYLMNPADPIQPADEVVRAVRISPAIPFTV